VLKGSIAGSVIGTLLFGVGVTIVAGGLSRPVQRFDREMVAINSALLMVATFGLVVPAAFHFSARTDEDISIEISVVLLLVYLASLVHTMTIKKPTEGLAAVQVELKEGGELRAEGAAPAWSRNHGAARHGGGGRCSGARQRSLDWVGSSRRPTRWDSHRCLQACSC
jgi:Ca2+:H+ antiporter